MNALSNKALSILVLREKFSIWFGRGLHALYDKHRKVLKCSDKEEMVAVRKKALRSKEEFRKFVSAGLENYVEELKGLIREGQSRGIRLLFVRQAYLTHEIPEGPHARYLPVIWEITDSVIQPMNVPSFDMQSYFQKRGKAEEIFRNHPHDPYHLTQRGGQLLTDGFVQALRELGWIVPR